MKIQSLIFWRFYLDPKEEHGLGNLVLKSFLDIKEIKVNFSEGDEVEIYREESTNKGNRIDLLIKCNDDWVLAIENKIWSDAKGNPFGDYENYVTNKFVGRKHQFVLLSPKDDKADGWDSVHYKEFIKQIETHLGPAIVKQPFNKWQVFLHDFLLNLKQLYEESNMSEIENIDSDFPKVFKQFTDLNKLTNCFLEKNLTQRGKFRLNKEFNPQIEFTGMVFTTSFPRCVYFWPKGKQQTQLRVDHPTENGWRLGFWCSAPEDVEKQRNKVLNESDNIVIKEEQPNKNESDIEKTYQTLEDALTDMTQLAKIIYHQPNQ